MMQIWSHSAPGLGDQRRSFWAWIALGPVSAFSGRIDRRAVGLADWLFRQTSLPDDEIAISACGDRSVAPSGDVWSGSSRARESPCALGSRPSACTAWRRASQSCDGVGGGAGGVGADASTGQGPKEGRRGAAVKRSSDAGIGLLEERIRPVLTKVGPLWHSALSLAALQRAAASHVPHPRDLHQASEGRRQGRHGETNATQREDQDSSSSSSSSSCSSSAVAAVELSGCIHQATEIQRAGIARR